MASKLSIGCGLPETHTVCHFVILSQRFPNFFERDPNPNLLNASRPMSQTTYEKNNHCMDEF